MGGYKPLKIVGNQSGLVQEREEFLLPDDAYPTLQNAYVWREKIKRKSGFSLLARLRRKFTATRFFNTTATPYAFNALVISGYVSTTDNANPGKVTCKYAHGLSTGDHVIISGIVGATGYNNVDFTITVTSTTEFTVGVDAGGFGAYTSGGFWYSNRTITGIEPEAELEPGTVAIVAGAVTFTDNGLGVLTGSVAGNSGTVNYSTGAISLTHTVGGGAAVTLAYNYFPGLPVMGLRSRERNAVNIEQTIAFDTRYAYQFIAGAAPVGGWAEYLPGYIWTGNNSDFFWSTNYFTNTTTNEKLMWVTNFSSVDPIRYTDGVTWTNFAPQINSGATAYLFKALILIPFRGRLLAINTYEGATLGAAFQYPQRIRYSAIGNPLAGAPIDAWEDDIRGKGGWLDIPTAEHIVSSGFVRDNLVIYCERSTWQLRYTGQYLAPFQIEKVNTELGVESTFSLVNFDTSIVGIGDKGIVECDSFKAERIDAKIPNLVERIKNESNCQKRVHGVRDFGQKLVYWIYTDSYEGTTFPNRRLVFNYENESWAIFDDSFTCFGYYQPLVSRRWIDATIPWSEANYPWVSRNSYYPQIAAGNQQGFVVILDYQVSNDPGLSIRAITGNAATGNPTRIRCPNHNLINDDVITISDIPSGTGYASLNGGVFGVLVVDADQIDLMVYTPSTDDFNTARLDAAATYIGGGKIAKRDNFSIKSKKFGNLDDGRSLALGMLDILLTSTSAGQMTMRIYVDYDDSKVNNGSDAFFNTIISTMRPSDKSVDHDNYWHRVYPQVQGGFYQIEYTLSNAQMISTACSSDVVVHGQILWQRPTGYLR